MKNYRWNQMYQYFFLTQKATEIIIIRNLGGRQI